MKDSIYMTEAQIIRAQKLFGAELRKHRKEFWKKSVQTVLAKDRKDLKEELINVFRGFVEFRDIIVRKVIVKYSRIPEEAITSTGFSLYHSGSSSNADQIIASIPRNVKKDRVVAVSFFWLSMEEIGPYFTDEHLEHRYRARGLKPADPYSLAAVNEADPDFVAKYGANSTHWKDDKGKWCFVQFDEFKGERKVFVRDDHILEAGWFAGVPVEKSQDSST